VPEKLDRLEIENRDLRARVDRLEQGNRASLDQELAELNTPGSGRMRANRSSTAEASKLSAASLDLSRSGLSQAFGGVYTKPFLADSEGVALGGYASWLYEDAAGAHRTFEFPRLIPFIYAQVSERVRFATEIEIEDGHEVEVEFALVDLTIADAFNLRAGVILDPLGRFNLVHDDPVNELTDRPLVDVTVIPTTLREVGVGAFGTLASPDSSIGRVAYEAYLATGFRGLFDDGTVGFDTTGGLDDGKPNETIGGVEPYEDNNNDLAQVGRIEWSPVLGAAIGLSAHHGDYDEGARNSLLLLAVDGALDGNAIARAIACEGAIARLLGGFELLGEWATADIDRDAFARSAGVPDDLRGWYGQLNYRLYPDCLKEWERSGLLSAGSHFTLVARRDEIDLDGFERQRWTFGVNFRPNRSQTVFKLDCQLNRESGATANADDDAVLVSVATYF